MTRPVAVITGGSAGIGYAIAEMLAGRDFDVAIAARNAARLDAAKARLEDGAGHKVVAVSADTREQEQVDALMESVLDRFGRIDALVNCAANPSGIAGAIEAVQSERLLDDLNTKVVGYVRCARAAVPAMKAQRYGRIVNIGGLTGRGSESLSGLRNVAISHLTKTLADELGPFGITVNAIHPGIVRTPHLDELFEAEADKRRIGVDEVEAGFVERIPIRRVLTPAEIGVVVAFLVSSAGAGITGESITVDGGYSRGIYL